GLIGVVRVLWRGGVGEGGLRKPAREEARAGHSCYIVGRTRAEATDASNTNTGDHNNANATSNLSNTAAAAAAKLAYNEGRDLPV
ncbi:unnamed protein product, partial [Ectocarpus sp. 8 AP-2014]